MLSGPLFQSPFIISHRNLRDKKLNLIDENVHVQLISKKRNFARFINPCTSGCDYTTKLSSPAHLLALSMGCPFSGLLMHPQKWEPGRGCKNLPRGFSRYTRAVGKATDQVLPPDSDVCCPDSQSLTLSSPPESCWAPWITRYDQMSRSEDHIENNDKILADHLDICVRAPKPGFTWLHCSRTSRSAGTNPQWVKLPRSSTSPRGLQPVLPAREKRSPEHYLTFFMFLPCKRKEATPPAPLLLCAVPPNQRTRWQQFGFNTFNP